MPKRALVISGGGSKGAFAVGVLKALAQNAPDTSFDIYIGTSTGSLIVPLAATGEIGQLEKVYTTVTTRDIIAEDNVGSRFLHNDSLLNAEPLKQLVARNYTDDICDRLFASPKLVCLVTTCLQTGETTYFSNQSAPPGVTGTFIKAGSPPILRNAIMASACQPVLMPPIEVEPGRQPLRQYVDGGVRMYAGIQLALEAGAEEIYAILLSAADDAPIEKNYHSPFDILGRTVDIFTTDTGINNVRQPQLFVAGLRYIADVRAAMLAGGISQSNIDAFFNVDPSNPFSNKPPAKIYIIRPDAPLGGGPGGLDFIPADMKAMLTKGQTIASQFLASLPANGSDMV